LCQNFFANWSSCRPAVRNRSAEQEELGRKRNAEKLTYKLMLKLGYRLKQQKLFKAIPSLDSKHIVLIKKKLFRRKKVCQSTAKLISQSAGGALQARLMLSRYRSVSAQRGLVRRVVVIVCTY